MPPPPPVVFYTRSLVSLVLGQSSRQVRVSSHGVKSDLGRSVSHALFCHCVSIPCWQDTIIDERAFRTAKFSQQPYLYLKSDFSMPSHQILKPTP